MTSFAEIQALYDRHLFLDAFRETADYWKPSTSFQSLSVDELVLAGRLASRLGGNRISRKLFRAAYEREPDNPRARYFNLYVRRRRMTLLDNLREFEAHPDICAEDSETQASWLASHAVTWAFLRDFARAHQCLDRARNLQSRDGWVKSCESDVLGMEDRWEEALQSAGLSWEISPGAPYAARSLSNSLLNLCRVPETAQRLKAASDNRQSCEIMHLACWFLCAWAETLSGTERRKVLDDALTLAHDLPASAPLADRDFRRTIAGARLDIAGLSDDHAEIERWAEEMRIPFYRKVLANLRKNPNGQRIRLSFPRVIQKHLACLPTSLSSAMSTQGEHLDPDVMAAEITFGGTWEWAAADWLQKRGYAVRHFVLTPQTASSLIKNEIGFVLTLEADDNAHAVAIVGLDESAGTLLVHDPMAYRTAEYLLEGFAEKHDPLAAKAMAVVLQSRSELLDRLLPEDDVAIMTAAQQHRKALTLRGPNAAREIVLKIAERMPSHPGTRLLRTVQAAEEGRTGDALIGFQQLLNEFPRSPFLRSQLIWACRATGNTTLMRETLTGVVEWGVLPGVQSQQEWQYPPARYVAEYADILRFSAETLRKAELLLQNVIRRYPQSADGWHILGDLLWRARDTDSALLCYRIASSLASDHEHYARAYADALAQNGKEQEGFSWLESRVRRFGQSPRATGTWITWIATLEEWGHPESALATCADALKQHPSSPELLVFVVPFLARMGRWEEAEANLQKLAATANPAQFHEGAWEFYRLRGDLKSSIEHAEAWTREAPRSMPARHALLDLVAKRDGAEAVVQLAARWMADHPGHDAIEQLYYQQLDRAGVPRRKKYSLLLRRVKRNPEDGWAWRELTLRCIEDFERSGDRQRERQRGRIQSLLQQCDRTGKEDAATIRVYAQWHQACAQWEEAVTSWVESIDREPANSYGYDRVWDCATALGAEQRRELWQKLEPILLRVPGHLSVARTMIPLLAQRFGVSAAEETVVRWRDQRPDDPEVAESLADLLLEHGHGRSDAERAHSILQSAVDHFPYHVGLRLSMVHACRKLGRLNEAEDSLREILFRHPDNVSARVQLAWVYELRGQGEEARKLLDEASIDDPQNRQISETLIQILMRHERFADAIKGIHTTLERAPHDVGWRNRAARLLVDCGDQNAAVQAARDGVRVIPRGAYLWYLLGITLNRLRQFADPGEIESCLRRSLDLNCSFFDPADQLSVLLVEQRRFDDAEQVMSNIQPRMCDPSPVRGRLAWIHRQRGNRREAVDEMATLVQAFPWYLWGWSLLIEWLAEDKDWTRARELLGVVPPEVRTAWSFRRQRLAALEQAGLPVQDVDAEWSSLLRDFPEELPLHLHRYDLLRDAKRLEESRKVLRESCPLNPDDPYYLARLVEVCAAESKEDEAVAAILRILFAETESSSWPAEYGWEALKRAHYGDRAYEEARASIERGIRPTPTAFSVLCQYALEKNGSTKVIPQSQLASWFPDRGVKELLGLLNALDSAPWASGAYRAKALDRLNKFGHYRLVLRYWRTHRQEVEADVSTWAETGRALASLKLKRKARRFLSSWRERRGVGMWIVANYVGCFSRSLTSHLKEVAASCGDALRDLPHDHCARYLAHLRAEACALLGDKQGLQQTWNQYRGYFDCKEGSEEWFQQGTRYLLTDIPMLVRYLEQNERGLYRKGVWALRWRRLWGTVQVQPRRGNSSQPIPVWAWWILLWMLIQLFRFIGSNGN